MTYPANYGFVPRTLDEDGAPLDALVLMQNAVVPLSVVRARLVGVVRFRDEGDSDDKLICVHIDDPMTAAHESVEALPEYQRDELKWFFESYKGGQDGAEVEGFRGVEEAQEVLKTCLERYEKRFKQPLLRAHQIGPQRDRLAQINMLHLPLAFGGVDLQHHPDGARQTVRDRDFLIAN